MANGDIELDIQLDDSGQAVGEIDKLGQGFAAAAKIAAELNGHQAAILKGIQDSITAIGEFRGGTTGAAKDMRAVGTAIDAVINKARDLNKILDTQRDGRLGITSSGSAQAARPEDQRAQEQAKREVRQAVEDAQRANAQTRLDQAAQRDFRAQETAAIRQSALTAKEVAEVERQILADLEKERDALAARRAAVTRSGIPSSSPTATTLAGDEASFSARSADKGRQIDAMKAQAITARQLAVDEVAALEAERRIGELAKAKVAQERLRSGLSADELVAMDAMHAEALKANQAIDRQVTQQAADDTRLLAEQKAIAYRINAERERAARDAEADANRQLDMRRAEAEVENRLFNERIDKQRREAEDENREYDRRQKFQSAQAKANRDPHDVAMERAEQRSNTFGAYAELGGGAAMMTHEFAALANFTIFNGIIEGITSTIHAIVSLDDVMAQFQAVTGASNSSIAEFKTGMLDLAATSRYSVHDFIEVAKELGETGLTVKEVGEALKPVMDFAAATGSSLKASADILTTTVDSFGLSVGRLTEVSDVYATVLNRTKLTSGQLDQGLNASAETAKELGISYQELASVFGTLANAGLRTSASLGAGVSQLMQQLQDPPAKLKKVFDQLGITAQDTSLDINGFTGVIDNLRAKGFGTEQALEGMSARVAKVSIALLENNDATKLLHTSSLLTTTATDGAKTSYDSLTASLHQFENGMLAITDKAAAPLLFVLKETFQVIATTTTAISAMSGPIEALGGLMTILVARSLALKGLSMAEWFLGVGAAAKVAAAGTEALAAAEGAASVGVGARLAGVGVAAGGALLTGLEALVAFITGPLGIALVGIGVVSAAAFEIFRDKSNDTAAALDTIKQALDDINTRETALKEDSDSVSRFLEKVISQRDRLNTDAGMRSDTVLEAQAAFEKYGLAVDLGAKNVDGLIDALRKLKVEMGAQLPTILEEKLSEYTARLDALKTVAYDDAPRNAQAPASLGDAGRRAQEIIAHPEGVDTKDVRGSTNAVSGALNTRLAELQNQLATLEEKQRTNPDLLDMIDKVPKLKADIQAAQDFMAAFGQTVGRLNAIQSAQGDVTATNRQISITGIRQDSGLVGAGNQLDTLATDTKARLAAVASDSGLAPVDEKAKLDEIRNSVKKTTTALLDQVTGIGNAMVAAGKDRGEVDAATADLKTKIAELRSLGSQEGQKAIEAVKKLMTKELAAEHNDVKDKVSAAIQSMRDATSQYQIDLLEAGVKALYDQEQNVLLQQALNDSGAKDLADLQSAKYKTQYETYLADKDKLATDEVKSLNQINLDRDRLAKKQDKAQQDALKAEEALIDKQIADLKAEISTAGTTAKVQELVKAIDDLIAKRTSNVKQQADLATTTAGVVHGGDVKPSDAAGQNATVNTIAQTLAAKGRSDLYGSALKIADVETGGTFNPNAHNASGATGLYQFMPTTWPQYGQGSVSNATDPKQATEAFVKMMDDIDAYFKKHGIDNPTDTQRYLAWQQGMGGAAALSDPANASKRAVDVVPAQNILQNGGNSSMTAAEFVAMWDKKFGDRTAWKKFAETGAADDANAAAKSKSAEADVTARKDATAVQKEGDQKAYDLNKSASEIDLRAGQANIADLKQQIKDTKDPGNAQALFDALIKALIENAKKEMDLKTSDPKFKELPAGEQANQIDQLKTTAFDRVKDQTETAIDEVSKKSLAAIEDQIKALEKKAAVEKGLAEENKIPQAQADATARQVAALKLQADQQQASTAASKALDDQKALQALADSGLATEKQIAALRAQGATDEQKAAAAKAQQAATTAAGAAQPSFSTAIQNGTTDYFKNSGQIDKMTGQFKSMTTVMQESWSQALGAMNTSMSTLFSNLASGTMTAKDAFKAFATSILTDMEGIASKALSNQIMQGLFGGLMGAAPAAAGAVTSGSGGLFSSLFSGLHFADGTGDVPGYIGRDNVPALLEPGEAVLNRSAVQAVGRDGIDALNASGGARMGQATPSKMAAPAPQKFSQPINLWVAQPDQIPPPGPNDILHIVHNDMLSNGQTKTLVKQIQAGTI